MTDTENVHSPIQRYHQGLIENRPEMVTGVLADDFIMFNGNFSAEPAEWQAHMYLSGQSLHDWPIFFLKEAGPYENHFEFIHTDLRGDAAVVVTRETGKNRFRSWENETVAWLLGRREGGDWRIVGYFIRDIRNLE